MAKPNSAPRPEPGDYSDVNVKRLFFGTEPQDEIDWIETLLSIDSEQGRVVPFKLYPQQIQMVHNQTGRDLTIKGRQTRASSLILARNLRRMVTNESIKCLVMTQDDQTTATFRARIKHHLRDLAQQGFDFRERKLLDNEDELVLDNESRFIWGSGHELTAGRAYSAHIVHLSEFAHWPRENAATLIGGISPSVPGPPAGQMDIESTPNGAEGMFYDMVFDSKGFNPDSRWSHHFYPWWLEPRYRAGTTPGVDVPYSEGEWRKLLETFRPTKEEQQLIDTFSLDTGQILWRRVRKAEQDKTNAPFLQEYVETLEGCFLMAGGNYFASRDGINHLEQYRLTVAPPKEIVERLEGSSQSFGGAGLHIWQTPQLGRPYAVWVDCAGGGLEDSADYSAVVVMDCANMAIVARLAVKVAPQEIAPMAVVIAEYYNTALLGGERDAFGSVCVAKIQDIGYRNLWYFIEPGQALSIGKPVQAPWGHPTQMRQHILNSLREQVFNGLFHTSDGWGVQQMGAFTWQKVAQKRHGLKEAGKGQKDDLVMCYAGLCYIAPLGSSRYNAKRGQMPTGPIQENEVVVVGRGGIVVSRGPERPAPQPWLK